MSFSKNKEKRSRSTSSETSNSFVKNVTSRVSGLLPATITKWFSSPSADSSSDDESPEIPITIQPAAKRMRYSSPARYAHYGSSDTNSETRNIDTESSISYSTIQSPPGRTTFTRETNFVSTPYRPATEDNSDKNDKDASAYKPQHSMSALGPTVATKRKSLFDSSPNSDVSKRACARTACNVIKDPKQPCFKPSLLGSPFYPGRTMYGGASTSYINHPNITQRKNTQVNETSNIDNSVSQSTRRIMDLLEHYSSPLNEAKRIPVITYSKKDSLNNSASSSNPNVPKTLSYKTQELHVPSIASLLRVKQRSRLMDTTSAARQIIASHSSTMHEYTPYPVQRNREENSNKFTTKVKSMLTNRRVNSDLESDLPEPVDLPQATLQIDTSNLPTFSFKVPAPKSISSTITTHTSTETVSKIVESKTSNQITSTPLWTPEVVVPKANPFKFSSPVKLPSESDQTAKTPPKYTFGSPERRIDQETAEKKDESSYVVGTEAENKVGVSNSKDWQCPDCWVSNKADIEVCVCCGAKKPTINNKEKSNKCTLCKLYDSLPKKDKCINCDKVTNNIEKPLTVKKSDSSKWDCNDCWVKNDESADKCVSCGANKPSAKGSATASKDAVTWKCDECWINNKASDDKCAACATPKPGAAPAAPLPAGIFNTSSKLSDNTFKATLAKQSEKWECPSCLVRNDSNKTKCVCCEQDKPGSEPKSLGENSFNFGVVPTFKFGIDLKQQETVIATEVKPVLDLNKKVQESETNNNVLPKSTTLDMPAGKAADVTDSSKQEQDKASTAPKLNFTFGIPQSTVTSAPVALPIFGNINKVPDPAHKSVTDEDEKVQEVPTVTLPLPEPKAPKAPSNLFTSSLTSKADDKPAAAAPPATFSAFVLPTSTPGPKATEATSVLPTPAAGPAEPAPKPMFSFSVKPSTELFAQPAADNASSASFTSPVQPLASSTAISFTSPQQNATTTTSTLMFQKPEANTTAASLFPSSTSLSNAGSLFSTPTTAPVSTAAPPAFGTGAPLFSFGNTNQTGAQQEKPKFNFTFGGNKSDAPSPFKAPSFNTPSVSNNANSLSVGSNIPTIGGNLGGSALSSPNVMGVGGSGLQLGSMAGNAFNAPQMSGSNSLGSNTNPLGGDSVVPNNPMDGNGLQTGNGGLFGSAPAPKENDMWGTNTSSNLFAPTTTASSMQKQVTFTFGSSTPAFNAPAFGSNAPAQPVFGMPSQNTSNAPLFGSPAQNASVAVFGAPPQPASAAPAAGMFAAPPPAAFGSPAPAPAQSVPSFEAPGLNAASPPAFTFGATQPQPQAFGFRQEQPLPQPAGVYSFGTPQFNIGNAGTQPQQQRRFRKVVRRNR